MKAKKPNALCTTFMAVVLAVSVFIASRKVNELSADPLGEKDCPPPNPNQVGSTTQANAVAITPPTQNNGLNWAQKGGTLNDASCLNRTAVYGVVKVKTEDDIRAALSYARENGLKVSIAGVRHSMGGQAFAKRRYDPLLIFTNTFYEKYGLTTVP